jgi:hypothetical protein
MTLTVDAVKLERLMKALQEILYETSRFLPHTSEEPPPESVAAREIEEFPRRDLVLTAYCQGDLLLEVASEHLTCFTRTSAEPALPIAAWSTVRAVIESGALASWLFDPGIDVRTRVKRSFAFRFEGLDQQLKAVRTTRNPESIAASSERINEVERAALEVGFSKLADQKDRRTGIGQVMPSVTSIVGTTLNEETTYRLLSAVTHAHPWALQQLGFQLLPTESDPTARIELRSLKKAAKPICFQFLARQAMKAFTTPVLYKTKLFGGDSALLLKKIRYYERRVTELAKAIALVSAEYAEPGSTQLQQVAKIRASK